MVVGEWFTCIYHSVSPSTLNGGGGGAHLHLPQCVYLYLEWRCGRVSFTTVCLPLPWVERLVFIISVSLPWVDWGEGVGGLILHNVTPSTWDGGRGEAHLHRQGVSLYLGWRWGRGSFEPFTMSLPLPGMEVWEGLIYIVRVSPST